MKSFLQSQEWAEFQRSVGRKVFQVGRFYIIKHELPFGKSYLYVPALDSMTNDECRMTNDIAKQENAIFVKVELMDDGIAKELILLGFRHSAKTIQPHRTVVLDLTKSEEELLGAMHHKTRYNIRVAEKHGIAVRESLDIEIFWNLMRKTTARDQFSSHTKEYYKKLLGLTKLYVAWQGTTPLTAALVLTSDTCAYYLHGASDHAFRSLMAPYALHWEIIKGYKLKAISYDFWGIDAKRYPGVTRFKLGWGGREVEYPGAFDLIVSPLCYTAYNILRK